MKFLVHGNGPHVSTGYGVQVAQLIERLRADGHEPAVSCTYGQQGAAGTWRGHTLYPNGYEVNGNDVIHLHAGHHFADDPNGWIITVLDVWALQNPLLAEHNVAAWCPVDHFPAPPGVLEFFKRTGATPLAMSRYGERLLFEAGLDPVYVPLAVDTTTYKPTPTVVVDGVERTGRELLGIPVDAFVVGMVAMNKGWARDRKGFNEAFRAFGQFWQRHQNAILYLHTEKFGGADGINLVELLAHSSVPEHAVRWVDQYAYRLGVPAELMAASYTAMDVLLAPSHGEGFCVPLIEAQACGTPVIATDATSQQELIGVGWRVGGQPEWDPAQHASYVCPSIVDIVDKLEAAYNAPLDQMVEQAVAFAADYDADAIYDNHWRPFLATLEPAAPAEPKEEMRRVDVIVPVMRADNWLRLKTSFDATNDGSARMVPVEDAWLVAETRGQHPDWVSMPGTGTSTFAEKVNAGLASSTADWVLIVGDDCEFKPGWVEAARKVSTEADVIGTNDTDGPPKNPDVAAGRHADHFFVRRSYIDERGACLDGPGVLAPEAYKHWYADKEIIGLARARGVFTPCLESVVVHHHPGYDGREDLRQADPVYMTAVDSAEVDERTFRSRLPLIEMQRVSRAKR